MYSIEFDVSAQNETNFRLQFNPKSHSNRKWVAVQSKNIRLEMSIFGDASSKSETTKNGYIFSLINLIELISNTCSKSGAFCWRRRHRHRHRCQRQRRHLCVAKSFLFPFCVCCYCTKDAAAFRWRPSICCAKLFYCLRPFIYIYRYRYLHIFSNIRWHTYTKLQTLHQYRRRAALSL